MTAIDELISKINYFYIDDDKKNIYLKLKKSIIFKSMGNPEIFLLSLILGLKYGKRKKITKSSNLFRTRELRNNVWIALSIGFAELKDLSIFETKEGARMAFRICEEYANSGIDILNDLIKKPSTFTVNLIEEILNN